MNGFKKYPYRIVCFIRYIYYKIIHPNTFKKNINKWFFLDGDRNYLLSHKLNKDSIVFEVGGYTGVFSDKIIELYDPYIYIFEPVKQYYNILERKYNQNPKIKIFNFGLSDTDGEMSISVQDDASSVFKNEGGSEKIILKDIVDFLKKEKIDSKTIDLISINIEGGEYPLVNRMLKKNCFPKNIQVQFHDFVNDAKIKRKEIIKLLKEKKYYKGYSFPFVWEHFKKTK